MKTIKRLIIAILIVSFPAMTFAQDKDKTTETVKFTTSIDCQACVNKVMTNLPQEKGIKDVKCDLTTKEIAVTYQKDKNNATDIRKAIEKLGYTAKPVAEATTVKK